MNKGIKNRNDKKQLHGYQQWYHLLTHDDIHHRSNWKNDLPIGYAEWHNSIHKETEYHIR